MKGSETKLVQFMQGAFITITLNDVSIENEADWTQMAKFHAEWSKRFFDVIVPYLK